MIHEQNCVGEGPSSLEVSGKQGGGKIDIIDAINRQLTTCMVQILSTNN